MRKLTVPILSFFLLLLTNLSGYSQCSASWSHTSSGHVANFTSSASGFTAPYYYWDFGDGTYAYSANPTHAYGAAGIYTVCLSVWDSIGWCADTICDTVHIVPAGGCSASFTYADSGCGAYFTNTSPSGAVSFQWYFSDGGSSTAYNPYHYFSGSGPYWACLYAYDSIGAFCDSTCQTVVLPGCGGSSCSAGFTVYPDSGCGAYFSNSSTGASSYQWYFSDGGSSTATSPYHSFSGSGPYYACLYTYDALGAFCDSTCQYFSLPGCGGASCSANFTYTSSGSLFNFTSSGTGYTSPSYWWDFGDGSWSTSANPSHTYTASGWYTVCLTIWDSLCADTLCQSVYVSGGSSCDANFTVYPDSGCGAYFTNSSTGAGSVMWYFSDGGSSTAWSPYHTFSGSGPHWACLYVYDSLGAFCDSTCQYFSLPGCGGSGCSASFTVTPDSGCGAYFNNTSTGGATYQWYFSDGGSATASSLYYTYSGSGPFWACLYVYDALGAFCDSTCQYFSLPGCGSGVSCTADFTTAIDSAGCVTVTDASTASGSIVVRHIDFGDGTVTSTPATSATHCYSSPGSYMICMSIETDDSCFSSTCDTILIGTTTLDPMNGFADRISIYPNPATDIATVEFDLPAGADVHISIADLQGRLVGSEDQGFLSAGNHKVSLNASTLAKGMYLTTIHVNDHVFIKKLIKQ